MTKKSLDTEENCKELVSKLKSFAEEKGFAYIGYGGSKVDRRAEGKEFPFAEHLKWLIYSLFSNMREWAGIENHAAEIDEIFFHYDVSRIKEETPEYFSEKIFAIHCGNMKTRDQMNTLHHNIGVMERLEKEYGSLDAFVTSDKLSVIIDKLSNCRSEYKLKMMGEALVCEYLRNVGIDTAKPDVHMRRMLGSERLGISKKKKATKGEVIDTFQKLSEATGFSASDLDYLFWSYCADKKGEICTATPACEKCVVREFCNKGGN
ncbi:MAG TPA: hypothetical protein O0X25_03985 [Methanocorpusculum sp.]|nr:hypothetical protein [Methanocorpusculum sp.]HJJ57404.1 hypothetical protein [Methanocorpusculum sp.]